VSASIAPRQCEVAWYKDVASLEMSHLPETSPDQNVAGGNFGRNHCAAVAGAEVSACFTNSNVHGRPKYACALRPRLLYT
jgi:hypothetical protein